MHFAKCIRGSPSFEYVFTLACHVYPIFVFSNARATSGMGVVADIIVFHPYDGGHWGFDCMGGRDPNTYNTTNDKFYLKYVLLGVC